jgi:hypothetical protein
MVGAGDAVLVGFAIGSVGASVAAGAPGLHPASARIRMSANRARRAGCCFAPSKSLKSNCQFL